jgi:hypothetical protein
LHPGRSFAAGRPLGPRSVNEIVTAVNFRLDQVSTPDLDVPPDAEIVEQLLLTDLNGSADDDLDADNSLDPADGRQCRRG